MKDPREDGATRAPSCGYHTTGAGRIPRENEDDRECGEQHIELGVDSSAGALDMTHGDVNVRFGTG